MSLHARIHPHLAWSDFVILRLFRRFAASRDLNENPMPPMVTLAAEIGTTAQAAIALFSLFQLSEATLGRPLVAECCCSRDLSPDERAIIAMFAAGQPTSWAIPHGLPGALCWALRSAAHALGPWPDALDAIPARTCPFTPA